MHSGSKSKSTQPKKVLAIIGTGAIAETHAEAICRVPQASLLGFYGRNNSRAAELANRFGTRTWDNLESLLTEPALDAVLIATPSGAHLEPVLAALEARIHVLCEKPLEVNTKRTQIMIQAAEDNGCLLCGFFPLRTGIGARVIRDAINQARFGRLTFASARIKWWRDEAYFSNSTWRGTYALDGGGALMNQGIHAVDLLGWLAGPVASVAAFKSNLAHPTIEVEDTITASLRFENGALGSIAASTATYPGLDLCIEISGTKGTAILCNDLITYWQFADELKIDADIRSGSTSTMGTGARDPRGISCEGHRIQIQDFCKALDGQSNSNQIITAYDSLQTIGVVEACYMAAKSASTIYLR